MNKLARGDLTYKRVTKYLLDEFKDMKDPDIDNNSCIYIYDIMNGCDTTLPRARYYLQVMKQAGLVYYKDRGLIGGDFTIYYFTNLGKLFGEFYQDNYEEGAQFIRSLMKKTGVTQSV